MGEFLLEAPPTHLVRRGFFFDQRERARAGSPPMLDISQHRSRKGTTMNLNKLLTALRQRKTPGTPPAGLSGRTLHARPRTIPRRTTCHTPRRGVHAREPRRRMAHRHLPPHASTPRRSPDHYRRADRVHPHALPLAQKRQVPESSGPPKGTKATSRAIRWRYARSSWCAAQSSWSSAAASPRSPSATKKVTGKASVRCRRYRRCGLICASTLVVRPFSPVAAAALSERRLRLRNLLRTSGISPAQLSTVTPVSRRRSSRLTPPSTARTSPTGGFSAAHLAGAAKFGGARFADAASFATVTFTGEVGLSQTRSFQLRLTSRVASFESDANFSRLNTAGIASFAAITFDGKAGIHRLHVPR